MGVIRRCACCLTVGIALRVLKHGSKFIYAKRFIVLPYALLLKKNSSLDDNFTKIARTIKTGNNNRMAKIDPVKSINRFKKNCQEGIIFVLMAISGAQICCSFLQTLKEYRKYQV